MICGPPPPAPLLIGQAPSSDVGDLLGQSGRRLALLCGADLDSYAETFARANLVSRFPGSRLNGGHVFPRAEAAAGWRALLPKLVPHGRVVLLGEQVARAAGLDLALFEWREAAYNGRPFLVTRAPHPSAVSRWWHQGDGVLRAAAWWREFYQQTRIGGAR